MAPTVTTVDPGTGDDTGAEDDTNDSAPRLASGTGYRHRLFGLMSRMGRRLRHHQSRFRSQDNVVRDENSLDQPTDTADSPSPREEPLEPNGVDLSSIQGTHETHATSGGPVEVHFGSQFSFGSVSGHDGNSNQLHHRHAAVGPTLTETSVNVEATLQTVLQTVLLTNSGDESPLTPSPSEDTTAPTAPTPASTDQSMSQVSDSADDRSEDSSFPVVLRSGGTMSHYPSSLGEISGASFSAVEDHENRVLQFNGLELDQHPLRREFDTSDSPRNGSWSTYSARTGGRPNAELVQMVEELTRAVEAA